MPYDAGDELLAPGLEVRVRERVALAHGEHLYLSQKEFGLLCALMRNVGRVMSREELYDVVWDAPLKQGDRSIDVYIRKLRAKLEKTVPGWRYVHTHHGLGYRFYPEPTPAGNHSVTSP